MKSLFKKYCILILLLFSIININIFMPISDSGKLTVAIIELLYPIIFVFLLYQYKRKKIELNKFDKALLLSLAIFLLYYFVICILRFLFNYEVKQSLLTIKVSVFPIVIIYFCKLLNLKKDNIIKNMILFNLIINIIQLNNFVNVRMSPFLGNIMVFLTLISLMFSLNSYVLAKRNFSLLYKIGSGFNIFLMFFFPLYTGSRSSFFISIVLFIMGLIYLIMVNRKRIIIFILLFLLSFGANIYINLYCTNYVASYANRILIGLENLKPNIMDKEPSRDDNVIIENNKDTINNNVEVNENNIIETEKNISDNLRFYLIKQSIYSIKKSPIIGQGIVYFNIDTNYGVTQQSAHNFILEYINSYGVLGALSYFSIIGLILFKIYTLFAKKLKEIIILVMCILALLVHSMVQPTMLIVPIMAITFVILSLFIKWGEENDTK